jgi:hypothetical protein
VLIENWRERDSYSWTGNSLMKVLGMVRETHVRRTGKGSNQLLSEPLWKTTSNG